jgi:hypothetical protein
MPKEAMKNPPEEYIEYRKCMILRARSLQGRDMNA